MSSTTAIEKENLETHVELCALRYGQLETRLSNIEEKVGILQKLIEDSHNSMFKVLVGTAGTVVTGIISLVIVMMTKN
jgi:hypothetical protein